MVVAKKCKECGEYKAEKHFFDNRFLMCRTCYAKISPHTIRCPRCNDIYDGYWQECDNCITSVYSET
jgi:ribosomal protein L40E